MTDFHAEMLARIASAKAEFATAIGEFSIVFASMEAGMDACIHEMLGLGEFEGAALTGSINSFTLRLDILRTLVATLEPPTELANALNDAVDLAEDLNSERNTYLHNPWAGSFHPADGQSVYEKVRLRRHGRKGVYYMQRKSVTATEVRARTDQCSTLIRSLADILYAISKARSDSELKRNAG